ncbi:hypothetical protein [Streptomyces gobiensis]|uniref:hypothetical protein n=1 Tax=Streptomyces gobiensis TaxID=2875706 RepID=UPI001E296523|nr:hypothetical protein [Streptomyces gobiensis]UGY92348.1 hypothetical protein test1122_11815 [Streptomyces gobiensis]
MGRSALPLIGPPPPRRPGSHPLVVGQQPPDQRPHLDQVGIGDRHLPQTYPQPVKLRPGPAAVLGWPPGHPVQ